MIDTLTNGGAGRARDSVPAVPSRRWREATAMVVWLATWSGAAHAAAPDAGSTPRPSGETDLRAAFVYSLARFVEWPADAFANVSAPVVVCVAGADEAFGAAFEQVTQGHSLSGHSIVVHRGVAPDRQIGCHVVYLTGNDRLRHADVLGQAHGASILTISEGPAFARDGGTVSFVVENRRVRFEVNLAAAERAHLKISSRVLALASAVYRTAAPPAR